MNEEHLSRLQKRFEDAIKSSGDTTTLQVEHVVGIRSKMFPLTHLYRIKDISPAVYMVDGLSQHGMLSLINIHALLSGNVQQVYLQQLGTYERDENRLLQTIHLEIAGKGVSIEQCFFDQELLDNLIAQRLISLREG